MKAIIDGKRYDTETAELIHEWDNGHYNSDFKMRRKTLYRTAKGSWFIYHEGGAMTDCARTVGNASTGDEYIEPVSEDNAFAFLASHDAAAAAEEHFADRIADA